MVGNGISEPSTVLLWYFLLTGSSASDYSACWFDSLTSVRRQTQLLHTQRASLLKMVATITTSYDYHCAIGVT